MSSLGGDFQQFHNFTHNSNYNIGFNNNLIYNNNNNNNNSNNNIHHNLPPYYNNLHNHQHHQQQHHQQQQIYLSGNNNNNNNSTGINNVNHHNVNVFSNSVPSLVNNSRDINNYHHHPNRKNSAISNYYCKTEVDTVPQLMIVTPKIEPVDDITKTGNDYSSLDFYGNEYANYEDDLINANLNPLTDVSKVLQCDESSLTSLSGFLQTNNTIEDENDEDQNRLKDDDKIRRYIDLKCDQCGAHFEIFSQLKQHFRAAHRINGYVICCNEKIFKRIHLMEHIVRHINEKNNNVKNDNNNIKYNNNSNITSIINQEQQHIIHQANIKIEIKEEEITTNNTFLKICQHCQEIFKNKKQYDIHILGHNNNNNDINTNSCNNNDAIGIPLITGMVASSTTAGTTTDSDSQRSSSPSSSAKVQCKQCDLWFKTMNCLQKHIKIHINRVNNDFVCSLCGRKTISDVALHRHIRNVHYKEKKYSCIFCGKAFKWSINLKEHMAIHTGESLYKCPHCPKRFNASSNLHSHRKKLHRLEWENERLKRIARARHRRSSSSGLQSIDSF